MVGLKSSAKSIITLAVALSGGYSVFCYGRIQPSISKSTVNTARRSLSFRERVTHQRALEMVYWRHRVWPDTNGTTKPEFSDLIPIAQIETKVRGYLEVSRDLQRHGQAVTPQQLQNELVRMAKQTRRPEVLRELWAALGNDPFVIAECLARPLLEARLATRGSQVSRSVNEGLAVDDPRPVDSPPESMRVATSSLGANNEGPGMEYRLASITPQSAGCADNTWINTSSNGAPSQRYGHTAIWTGSEMIVWGGYYDGSYFNNGGRYDPATDTWLPTELAGAPSPRRYHAAVWSGFELIVWGGSSSSNLFTGNGARYSPMTNSWTPITESGAPVGRYAHSGIWTGNEMIVWGGTDGNRLLNSGGRYDPSANTWQAMSLTGAPVGRRYHTSIWTGSEMIVWGGEGNTQLNSGGKYNPLSDTWSATTTVNAPAPRDSHSAIFTGTEMIIWGGSNGTYPYYLSGGARYSPSGDSWSPLTTNGEPGPRSDHTAIWTGREMILWGGSYLTGTLNTGGRYDPAANTWKQTGTSGAPPGRYFHSAVWTGSEMIIFGASAASGGRYCAAPASSQCSYSVTPGSSAFPANGGSGSVSVTTGDSCGWTAASNNNWITISPSGGGTGSGSVTYSVAANSTANNRTGILSIAGHTVTIAQDASTGSCTYSISPTSKVFKARGGTSTIEVTAPAGCGWSATTNASWITISSPSGTGNGVVSYTVSRNSGSSARRATITIGGQTLSIKQRSS
jgi:hypothetical protein